MNNIEDKPIKTIYYIYNMNCGCERGLARIHERYVFTETKNTYKVQNKLSPVPCCNINTVRKSEMSDTLGKYFETYEEALKYLAERLQRQIYNGYDKIDEITQSCRKLDKERLEILQTIAQMENEKNDR